MIKAYKEMNVLIRERIKSPSVTSEIDIIKIIGEVLIEFNEKNKVGFKGTFDFHTNVLRGIMFFKKIIFSL